MPRCGDYAPINKSGRGILIERQDAQDCGHMCSSRPTFWFAVRELCRPWHKHRPRFIVLSRKVSALLKYRSMSPVWSLVEMLNKLSGFFRRDRRFAIFPFTDGSADTDQRWIQLEQPVGMFEFDGSG